MEASSSPLRIGVIGTGIFALNAHLPAMKALSDKYTVVACCNRSKDKADAYAAAAGVPSNAVFTDYQSVIDLPEVDAVTVALPVQFNEEVIKAALAKGKHVLCEKPIAASLEQAQGIIDAADAHPSLVVSIAENFAHKHVTAAIADIVAKGELGDIVSFELSVQRQFDLSNNPYANTAWRQNPAHPGGYLSDGGVHWTALILSTLGPVKSVGAFVRQIHKINGAEDTLAMIFQMQSGVIGTWHQTYAAAAPSFGSYIITGTKATLVCDELRTVKVTNKAGEIVKDVTFEDEDSGPTTKASQDVVAEFVDFHSAIARTKSGAAPESSTTVGKEEFVLLNQSRSTKVDTRVGFHHFAIIVAAMRSAESRKFEDVPHPTTATKSQ